MLDGFSPIPSIDGANPTEGQIGQTLFQLAVFREIFLESEDGIAVIDLQGRYLLQNAAHEELVGYTDAELAGRTPAIHLGDETMARIAAALKAEGRYRGEVTSIGKSGVRRTLELSAFTVRTPDGEPMFYVGSKRDITARRAAEEELRRSYEELQVLHRMAEAVNRATDLEDIHAQALDGLMEAVGADRAAVLRFDDAGVMRFAAWRRLSDDYRRAVDGHSPWTRETEDPQPIAMADVVAEPGLSEELRAAILGEGIRALAFIPLCHQGELLGKFMLYYDAPHVFEAGELQIAQTLASHVAFAIARHQREEKLRAASQAKSTFLAAMSHELRTPLNAILGYSDLMDMGVVGELNPRQAGHLQRIRAGATHLLGVIEEILTFSRVEAGKEVVRPEPLDATRLAYEAAALIRPAAELKGLQFRVDLPDGALPLQSDPGKLRQVLLNLLSNAVKFTDAGSIAMAVEPDGGNVVFRISDTGSGIAPDHLPHVFEPFWQADQSITRRAGGTGLGLTVTHQLVDLLGGDVAIRSQPGAGSEFIVTLPATHS